MYTFPLIKEHMKAKVNDALVFSDHVLYQTFLPKSDLLFIDALQTFLLLIFLHPSCFWQMNHIKRKLINVGVCSVLKPHQWLFQPIFFWVPLGFCFWILVCFFYAISRETLTITFIVAPVILGWISIVTSSCAEPWSNEQKSSVVDSYSESFSQPYMLSSLNVLYIL